MSQLIKCGDDIFVLLMTIDIYKEYVSPFVPLCRTRLDFIHTDTVIGKRL